MALQEDLGNDSVVSSLPEASEQTHTACTVEYEDDFCTTDDQKETDGPRRSSWARLASSQSSVSSLPGSVIHHEIHNSNNQARTLSRSRRAGPPLSPYMAAFRHPSSIRALQMESELESEVSSQRRTSRVSSPYFPRSPGSSHSSPAKRTSRSGTPRRTPKVKKEFPLVLLHCTLLPAVLTPAAAGVANEVVEAVLPEEYRQKWRLLRDKLWRNNEIRQRGVLVPHPREDYGLLEERLLDALELERPRVRQGHFLPGDDATDSGIGSEYSDSDPDTDQGDQCPDCGCLLSPTSEHKRTWRVRVYAANGLMSAGAWAAAWQEMEKVDVEIVPWLPDEVRREVDERLTAVQAKEAAGKVAAHEMMTDGHKKHRERNKSDKAKLRQEERMKEIYGEKKTAADMHDEINNLIDDLEVSSTGTTGERPSQLSTTISPRSLQSDHTSSLPPQQQQQSPLSLTHIKYQPRAFFHDQRNIAIILLSFFVLWLGLQATSGTTGSHSTTPVQAGIPNGSTSLASVVAAHAAEAASIPPEMLISAATLESSRHSTTEVHTQGIGQQTASNRHPHTTTADKTHITAAEADAGTETGTQQDDTGRTLKSAPSTPNHTEPENPCLPPSLQVLLESSGHSSRSNGATSPATHAT